MADKLLVIIVAEERRRGTFGDFSEYGMQSVRSGMWNKVEYALKDSQKLFRSIKIVFLFKSNAKCVE